jgi:hypothetical protein
MVAVSLLLDLLQEAITVAKDNKMKPDRKLFLIFCIHMFFFNANIFLKPGKENVKGSKADKTTIEKDGLNDEFNEG